MYAVFFIKKKKEQHWNTCSICGFRTDVAGQMNPKPVTSTGLVYINIQKYKPWLSTRIWLFFGGD